MNADVDLLFYDTTSLHFELDEEDEAILTHQERRYEPLRKRGYAKNGRSDAPQLVVGLAVTREGSRCAPAAAAAARGTVVQK